MYILSPTVMVSTDTLHSRAENNKTVWLNAFLHAINEKLTYWKKIFYLYKI